MEDFLLQKLTDLTDDELLRYDRMAMSGISKNGFVISDKRLTKGRRDVIVLPHTRNSPTPLHSHTYVEIMIVLSGKVSHTVDGNDVCLKVGDILFLNRHISHSIAYVGKDDIAVNIIMSSGFLSGLTGELYDTVFSDFMKENSKADGRGVYLHFHTAGKKQLENLVENILFELTEYETNTAILGRSVSLLFHYLSLKSEELLVGGNMAVDKAEARKIEILSYLRSNYRTANLTDLAHGMNISTPYLSKTVKEYFGQSFKELLLEERMKRAIELFEKTDVSIGDAIRSLGYENSSYFHREFKKRTGTTPNAIRRKNKKECKV